MRIILFLSMQTFKSFLFSTYFYFCFLYILFHDTPEFSFFFKLYLLIQDTRIFFKRTKRYGKTKQKTLYEKQCTNFKKNKYSILTFSFKCRKII